MEAPSPPMLPAAMTNSESDVADSSSTAVLSGSVPSETPPPRLMLTTSAPWSTAHCMPARTIESSPLPVSSSTLPTSRSAPGATPLRRPPEAAPLPAIVAATCVPWP